MKNEQSDEILKGRDIEIVGSHGHDLESYSGETDEDDLDSVTLAERRASELKSGKVVALTEEEFWHNLRHGRQ